MIQIEVIIMLQFVIIISQLHDYMWVELTVYIASTQEGILIMTENPQHWLKSKLYSKVKWCYHMILAMSARTY